MKKFVMAAALSVACIATPALAQNAYIGINAGQNDMDFPGVKASTAMGVFGGYSFTEFIAVELGYVDFGKVDTDVTGVSVKGNATSLVAVGSLPLSRDFSLFAKLGYASTKVESATSETKEEATYGVGAQFNPANNIGIRLGYDNYRVGEETTKDSALISLAVLFKF